MKAMKDSDGRFPGEEEGNRQDLRIISFYLKQRILLLAREGVVMQILHK